MPTENYSNKQPGLLTFSVILYDENNLPVLGDIIKTDVDGIMHYGKVARCWNPGYIVDINIL